MIENKEEALQKALQQLSRKETQEKLAEIFTYYGYDLYNIFVLATVENAGERPENLTNEIFSCFHHIARAMCLDGMDVQSELRSALGSHLKRATLDSYKISISSYLEDDQKLRDVLDYLVLAEDFSRYVPNGLEKTEEIREQARKVKYHYERAKLKEASGKFDDAMSEYNSSLEECVALRDKIKIFTNDKVYLLAAAREAKQQENLVASRRVTMRAAILSAIISATLAWALTVGLPKIWPNTADAASNDAGQNNKQVSAALANPGGKISGK